METFKLVLGVPTKVICYGKHIEEDLSDVSFLILVIPGRTSLLLGIIIFVFIAIFGIYENFQEILGS